LQKAGPGRHRKYDKAPVVRLGCVQQPDPCAPAASASTSGACQRTVEADLAQLINGGKGDVALLDVPWRCACGSL
jgi:hypothetical protein